jgi:hypothetical protein
MLIALCFVGICEPGAAQTGSAPADDAQLHPRVFPDFSGKELEPRCALIANMGPAFGPLVGPCQYALAQATLPNLICEETIVRKAHNEALDTIEAEVRIVDGLERYTKATVDGKVTGRPNWHGGWGSNAFFSGILRAVFYPDTKTTFKLAKDSTKTETGRSHFEFSYPENHARGFDVAGENPPMHGSLWVDRSSGQLVRLETISKPAVPPKKLRSYHSAIDYKLTPIPPLGLVLLPAKAAVQACVGDTCFQNVATFHGCRKFGSQVRILPEPPQ